jgi:hypothetical protein
MRERGRRSAYPQLRGAEHQFIQLLERWAIEQRRAFGAGVTWYSHRTCADTRAREVQPSHPAKMIGSQSWLFVNSKLVEAVMYGLRTDSGVGYYPKYMV